MAVRIILLLFWGVLGVLCDDCLDVYDPVSQNCYIHGQNIPGINDFTIDFFEAETECQKIGGHVVSIESQEESDFIGSQTQWPNRGSDTWIGLTRAFTMDWFWSDGLNSQYYGHLASGPYTNWKQVPDLNDRCIRMKPDDMGWEGSSCSNNRQFICKYINGTTSTNPWDNVQWIEYISPSYGLKGTGPKVKCDWKTVSCPTLISWRCLMSITDGGIGGHVYSPLYDMCYRFMKNSAGKTWVDHHADCRTVFHPNSSLATVRSMEEKDGFSTHTSFSSTETFRHFIGLTSLQNPQRFFWVSPWAGNWSNFSAGFRTWGGRTANIFEEELFVSLLTEEENSEFTLNDFNQNRDGAICEIQMCGVTDKNEVCVPTNGWNYVTMHSSCQGDCNTASMSCDYTQHTCPHVPELRFNWPCINSGGTVIGSSCYVFHSSTQLSPFDAEMQCRAMYPSGHLPSFHVQSEYNAVNDIANRKFGNFNWNLGLNEVMSEGYLKWMDGSPLDFEANYNGYSVGDLQRNCFYRNTNDQWVDADCSDERRYMCQVSCNPHSSVDPIPGWEMNPWENVEYYHIVDAATAVMENFDRIRCPSKSNCPTSGVVDSSETWTWECLEKGGIAVGSKCAVLMDETNVLSGATELDWFTVERLCRSEVSPHAHLLTMHDESVILALEQYMDTRLQNFNRDMWLGLNQIHKAGEFEWTSGEAVTYTQGSLTPSSTERCVFRPPTGIWDVFDCNTGTLPTALTSNQFVCVFDLDGEGSEWDNMHYFAPNNFFCNLEEDPCPDKYSTCYDAHFTSSSVCSNSVTASPHGVCSSYDNCTCFEGYFTQTCANWTCNGINHYEPTTGCPDNGYCIDYDTCLCHNDVPGVDCSIWMCNHTLSTSPDVCSARGECIWPGETPPPYSTQWGVSEPYCRCQNNGYFGDNCQLHKCYGQVNNNTKKVCTGHGKCIDVDTCECANGFMEEQCQGWRCFDVDKKNPLSCSGHGTCVKFDECECGFLRYGPACQNDGTQFLIYGSLGAGLILFVCITFVSIVVISVLVRAKKRKDSTAKHNSSLSKIELLENEYEKKNADDVAHLIVNKKLFEIKFEDIKLIEVIGQGGSDSSVFRAQWNDLIIAFKIFKSADFSDQRNFSDFEAEVSVLSSVNHPNIVNFYGCSLNPPRVGIVFEFCENGDLEQFVQRITSGEKTGVDLSFEFKCKILKEVASAMAYLHDRNIMHRDLKSPNILVDKNLVPKLTDFGIAKMMLDNQNSSKKTKRVGTSYYMAPEVVLGRDYSSKCDVFSFSMIMFELFEENFQIFDTSIENLEFKIANDSSFRPTVKDVQFYPPTVLQLMLSCWGADPDERPDFGFICNFLGGFSSK